MSGPTCQRHPYADQFHIGPACGRASAGFVVGRSGTETPMCPEHIEEARDAGFQTLCEACGERTDAVLCEDCREESGEQRAERLREARDDHEYERAADARGEQP